MRFPLVPQHLLIEWLNGLARVPIGGRPVVRTGVQVSVFSGRLHRIPRTYPRFWAGLRALKLPIYPFFWTGLPAGTPKIYPHRWTAFVRIFRGPNKPHPLALILPTVSTSLMMHARATFSIEAIQLCGPLRTLLGDLPPPYDCLRARGRSC